MKKYNDPAIITIKCNQSAADELIPLLKELRIMGSIGSSRSIQIEDWDGENNFGFDGDGPSAISEITQDGKMIKAKTIKASCGDEMEYKLRKEGLYKDENGSVSVPATELKMGIKVEMEHTNSQGVAEQIALDHLMEDPNYYTHLKEMEDKHMEKAIARPLELVKAKYTKRTGTPGNYQYFYGPEGSGNREGKQPESSEGKRPESSEGKQTKWTPETVTKDVPGFIRWAIGNGKSKSAIANAIRKAIIGAKSTMVPPETINKWIDNAGKNIKKSYTEEDMEEATLALVLVPGELTKAAKLSGVGSGHPAKLSTPGGNTKSKIPYTSHTERMKLAKMAGDRMLGRGAVSPEDESAHTGNPTVDRKGRVAGEKDPYSGYATGVSGMGSQAHDNFGKQTYVVKPSEIGSSAPEATTKHTPVKNVRKPKV